MWWWTSVVSCDFSEFFSILACASLPSAPRLVEPQGGYSESSLETANGWARLSSSGKIKPRDRVHAVLKMMSSIGGLSMWQGTFFTLDIELFQTKNNF